MQEIDFVVHIRLPDFEDWQSGVATLAIYTRAQENTHKIMISYLNILNKIEGAEQLSHIRVLYATVFYWSLLDLT